MEKIKKNLVYVLLVLFYFNTAMAIEESNYEVVKKTDIYEIRYYPERIVVQTSFSYEDRSFGKLFRYISGSNELNQEIKMTTPVTEMNVNNSRIMQFFLPSEFTIKNAPNPNDPNVEIKSINEGYYAVIQYSGRSSDQNFIQHKNILYQALIADGINVNVDDGIKATYNGPYTLPILRRNEAMFNITWNK